ncbi:MAG TPA: hypothetical protein VIM14_02465 [Polyangia bacterium]
MNELGPAAREMVETHRRGKVLTRADRERIKQNLMLQVATLGATTAATGTAMGMSLASKIALVALGVTAMAGAGTFSMWALRGRAPAGVTSPTQISLPRAPETIEPAPEASPEDSFLPADSADTGRIEHVKKASKRLAVAAATPSPAAVPAAPLDPEPELRVLREAREDLRADRSEIAYRRLDDYGRQHSGGMLAQERRALSAIALCEWKPGPEAQTRAADFLRTSPESPLAKRVRSACDMISKPPR